MKKFFRLLILSPAIFTLSGCSNDNLPRIEQLQTFRVLALSSNKSELNPGDTATISAILSDTQGSGRTINVSYVACADPGVSTGATPSCNGQNVVQSATVTINPSTDSGLGANNYYSGESQQTATFTIPSDYLDGLTDIQKHNGRAYLVVGTFTVASQGSAPSTTATAFKRIIVTSRASSTHNQTPVINSLLLNEQVIAAAAPSVNDELSITADAPETFERYTTQGELEERSEEYDVAWYVASGKLSTSKTDVQSSTVLKESTPVNSAVAGQLIMILLRDDRGGVSLKRQIF